MYWIITQTLIRSFSRFPTSTGKTRLFLQLFTTMSPKVRVFNAKITIGNKWQLSRNGGVLFHRNNFKTKTNFNHDWSYLHDPHPVMSFYDIIPFICEKMCLSNHVFILQLLRFVASSSTMKHDPVLCIYAN